MESAALHSLVPKGAADYFGSSLNSSVVVKELPIGSAVQRWNVLGDGNRKQDKSRGAWTTLSTALSCDFSEAVCFIIRLEIYLKIGSSKKFIF